MPVRRCPAEDVVPLRAEILRPGLPVETAVFDGDQHPLARHWVLEDAGGAALACLSVLPAPSPRAAERVLQLRGMAAAAPGNGAGSELIRAVQSEVDAPMWCNARARAIPFYERHGWVVVSPLFELKGVGPHVEMHWSPR